MLMRNDRKFRECSALYVTCFKCRSREERHLDFPSKMIFGKTTPVVAIESVKFQKFCPARSDCNNVAHGILSFYKLQDVFS